MAYNSQMDRDKTLDEFVQILARIKYLAGEATTSNDNGIDLPEVIEQLRLSGNDKDADELSELIAWADKLKAQQQAKS